MLNLDCQKSAIEILKKLASHNQHIVIISGTKGCGKSFLVNYYAELLNIPDITTIDPSAQNFRDLVTQSMNLTNPMVIGIENLDSANLNIIGTLLKFIEEPKQNIYVVITVTNIYGIPDTICSRGSVVNLGIPTSKDIERFAETINSENYETYKHNPLWEVVRNLSDVKTVLNLDTSQIDYINGLSAKMDDFSGAISDIVWRISHYQNNQPTPIDLILRYMIQNTDSPFLRRYALTALDELSKHRIAPHIILSKFVADCKYLKLRRAK